LVTSEAGVLCWIDLVIKIGTTIKRGLAPFVTPNTSASGAVIAAETTNSVPDAATFIIGEGCAKRGFVILKENVYVVPDTSVNPARTFKVNMPELHAPVPCVVPSENMVSPSLPAYASAMGLVAVAFDIPEMVTTELSEDVKFALLTRVTVNVLDDPGRGLL